MGAGERREWEVAAMSVALAPMFAARAAVARRRGEGVGGGLELDGTGGAHIAGWNCDVFPVESQDSMSAPALGMEKGG